MEERFRVFESQKKYRNIVGYFASYKLNKAINKWLYTINMDIIIINNK